MVAQGAPRTGRRPGNQDTRGQILDAARQAFAGRGFAATSIRAIAADAGVDAALVHHYFDSKQQLFLATVSLPQDLPTSDSSRPWTAAPRVWVSDWSGPC